jgi:hypothetical protein
MATRLAWTTLRALFADIFFVSSLQDLFEEGFDKPFLVTYLNTAAFSFYLIPFTFRYVFASIWPDEFGDYAEIDDRDHRYQRVEDEEVCVASLHLI